MKVASWYKQWLHTFKKVYQKQLVVLVQVWTFESEHLTNGRTWNLQNLGVDTQFPWFIIQQLAILVYSTQLQCKSCTEFIWNKDLNMKTIKTRVLARRISKAIYNIIPNLWKLLIINFVANIIGVQSQ